MKTEVKEDAKRFNPEIVATMISFRVPYSLKLDLMREAMDLKISLSEYLYIMIQGRELEAQRDEKINRLEEDKSQLQANLKASKELFNKEVSKHSLKAEKASEALKIANDNSAKVNRMLESTLRSNEEMKKRHEEMINKMKASNEMFDRKVKDAEKQSRELLSRIEKANERLKELDVRVGGGFLEKGTLYQI